jgi:hypothetical protein
MRNQSQGRQRLETDALQSFVEFGLSWLQERNYALTLDVDMARWCEVMRTTARSSFINPAFDPRHSRLSPANSFWLDVRFGSSTIATSAARLLLTDDYFELQRSMRLWYENPPHHSRLAITAPNVPAISGRVGHEGGLWVDPGFRKRGLSVILPHLNRALCFREWSVAWQTGITSRGIGESGLAERAYGFPHVVPCFEGFLPVTGNVERLYATYMSAEELVAALSPEAVARLLPDHYGQPIHAAGRV